MNQFYKKLSVLIIFTCFIYTNTFALTKNESIIPPELQKKLEEVYGMETTLHYPAKYAGTADLVGIYQGQETIIDFKQSNKPAMWS